LLFVERKNTSTNELKQVGGLVDKSCQV